MPFTTVLRRMIVHWQHRRSQSLPERFSDDGDTLVEVLIAMVVLSIAATALLLGFATSITSSVEHRNLASLDSSTRLAANLAIADVQQQAGNPANNPFLCGHFVPDFSNVPSSFTVTAVPWYWNGSAFNSANPCVNYAPQQYTLTITSTASTHYSSVVTTVVYDPSSPPPPNGVGVPSKLVWIPPNEPTGGSAYTPFTPQPEVAVEDSSGDIVSSDLSTVTIQVLAGPGRLSTTCSGVESYGIVQFSDCSFNAAGAYQIRIVDSNSAVTPTPTDSFTVNAAPPAKIVFLSAPVTGTASNSATLGPAPSGITIQEQDFNNNPTTVGETVNLSAPGGVFSLTQGGPLVTSVSIPSGSSTVSFYYGDTVAGTDTITAGVGPPQASGTQQETIKAGAASQLGFTSPAFTAPSSNSATAPFTVAIEDQFGNVTTKTTSTTVTLASSSGTGLFSANKGGATTTTVMIGANQTSVTAYYGDTTVGTPTLTASAPGLSPSPTQTETITLGPTKLVFLTGPVSGNDSTNAAVGPITVQEQASNGTPTTIGETVNVTSNSAGTYIFNASAGATTPTGATTVAIPPGQSSVTFYYGDTKPGTPTITAAAAGLTSATQTESITVGPVASFLLSNPGPQTAGTAFTETVTAEDAGGNTVTGYNGANCLTFSGPANSPAPSNTAPLYPVAGTCSSGSSVTFTNGVAQPSVTLYDAAPTVSLHVVDALIIGSSPNFTVSAGATSTFALSTPSPTAGTQFTETITAKDNYSNTTTSYNARECVTFSGPGNSPAPSNRAPAYPGGFGGCAAGTSSVNFTNGVGTANITLYNAAPTTLTATQGAITGSVSFTVMSGGLGSLTVANPGTQAVGVGFNVTITALDGYSNPISGTLSPTFSGPSNSPNGTHPIYPTSVTFTSGSATAPVTLFDAQTTTLRVTSGAVSGTSTNFIVKGGSTSGFTLSNPGTQAAGTAFTETITAGDAYGNSATGFTGDQCVTFSGPANSPAPSNTPPLYPAAGTCATGSSVTFNANGVGTASITLFNAAASTTLTATSGTLSGSVTFAVSSGSVKALTFPTTPATQTAGTSFNTTLDATDGYGNAFAGTACITFGGAANSPAPSNTPPLYPAAGTCGAGSSSLTFAGGAATASITLYDASTTTSLTASATGASLGTTNTFTVNPAGANAVAATSGSAQTAHVSTAFRSPLVATVTDTYSNDVPSASVTFSGPTSANTAGVTFSAGGNCVSNPHTYSCVAITAPNGQATSSTMTANAHNGTYNVAATVGTATVNFSETNSSGTVTVAARGTKNATNATGTSVTLPVGGGGNPTAGSTLVVLVYAEGNGSMPSAPTIAGSAVAGTATLINSTSPGGSYGEWAYWVAASGNGQTVNATFSTNVADIELDAVDLAGDNAPSPIVSSDTNTGTNKAPTAILAAAPGNGDLELVFFGTEGGDGGAGTTPNNWTRLENNNGAGYGAGSYYTVTAGSTSQAFAITNTVPWSTIAIDVDG